MFNFLVTGMVGDWDNGAYEWNKGRILEFTDREISDALGSLSPKEFAAMQEYPCLFAYEGKSNDMRVGSITRVRWRKTTVVIEFKFDELLPPISYSEIERYFALLDIRKWEMSRTHWAVKDCDLLDVLREKNLIPPSVQRSSSTKKLESAPKTDVQIDSVQAFIKAVLAKGVTKGREIFYRGHSDRAGYKLEPSLFRKDEKGNPLYLINEHILYRELLVSNSADFATDTSTLDKLVRMQHFSLPTRLLDITSNPLMALYFACNSKPDVDGEVIAVSVSTDQVKYFDSDTASCLANLARLQHNDEISYPQRVDDDDEGQPVKRDIEAFNEQLPVKRLVHFIAEEKPFFASRINPNDLRRVICVKGKRTNDRISSQSGAFLLFGDNARLSEEGDEQFQIARFAITDKKRILAELDSLNINESTVFPYIENSAKYVAAKYRFKRDEDANSDDI